MSDYKTANLKPETMQRLREYAVGDESVDSAVQRLLDSEGGSDTDLSQLTERLDEINRGVREATEAAQSAERSVEQFQ